MGTIYLRAAFYAPFRGARLSNAGSSEIAPALQHTFQGFLFSLCGRKIGTARYTFQELGSNSRSKRSVSKMHCLVVSPVILKTILLPSPPEKSFPLECNKVHGRGFAKLNASLQQKRSVISFSRLISLSLSSLVLVCLLQILG